MWSGESQYYKGEVPPPNENRKHNLVQVRYKCFVFSSKSAQLLLTSNVTYGIYGIYDHYVPSCVNIQPENLLSETEGGIEMFILKFNVTFLSLGSR